MRSDDKLLNIALVGNPNSGKTTIFNFLTGSSQHVGNYPGVTIEKKSGSISYQEKNLQILDLPGIYSFTTTSPEEIITRNVLLHQRPDIIVNVIDSSNLERNLFLAVQMLELKIPLVFAFNMSDIAKRKGVEFNIKMLSKLFDVPIILTVGNQKESLNLLIKQVVEHADKENNLNRILINYGKEIESAVAELVDIIDDSTIERIKANKRWIALKLLEKDQEVLQAVKNKHLLTKSEELIFKIKKILGDDPEVLIADRRYGFISGACQEATRQTVQSRHSWSDWLDLLVTHRVLGLPIFFALMYLTFFITFKVSAYPMMWLETLIEYLSTFINDFWPFVKLEWLRSLIVDGVINGVGGVLVFLPNILLLFLSISILEDSGYMARAAFIMDRFMHKIGLHGKSFIPMILGFGCSVPAIMATRSLEDKKDRLTTMMIIPLMSCGAKLPIYSLIIPAFFPKEYYSKMVFAIYLIGIGLAIIVARVLRSTVLKGEDTLFVMELPIYRLPTLRGLFIHMVFRGKLFLKKAGSIILLFSIILWVFATYPQKKIFDKDYVKLINKQEQNYKSSVFKLAQELKTSLSYKEIFSCLTSEKESLGDIINKDHLFLDFINKLHELRVSFQKNIIKYDISKSSKDYLLLENKLALDLNNLRNTNQYFYDIAMEFIDQVHLPHLQKIKQLKYEQSTEIITYSILGRVGKIIEPVIKPMGFDWRIGTALLGSFAGKELFVAQMSIIYSIGEKNSQQFLSLRNKLKNNYSPLTGVCIMLFCLICSPCIATIAATKQETNSWWWAMFPLFGLTIMAYVICVIVFQLGSIIF